MNGTLIATKHGGSKISVAFIGIQSGSLAGLSTLPIAPSQVDQYKDKVGNQVEFDVVSFVNLEPTLNIKKFANIKSIIE